MIYKVFKNKMYLDNNLIYVGDTTKYKKQLKASANYRVVVKPTHLEFREKEMN